MASWCQAVAARRHRAVAPVQHARRRSQLPAGRVHRSDARPASHVYTEAARALDLRHEVDVGQGWRIANAEAAAPGIGGQQLLDRVEARLDPGVRTSASRPTRRRRSLTQRLQYAAVVERVDVAADDGGERAHACAAIGSAGSSGGVGCVSSSHSMIAGDWISTRPPSTSAGTRPCGCSRDSWRCDALAAQVDRNNLVGQALEVQRDAQPVRGAAAEEGVELHDHRFVVSRSLGRADVQHDLADAFDAAVDAVARLRRRRRPRACR